MTFINAYKVETKNMLHSSVQVLGNMFKPVPATSIAQSDIIPTANVSFYQNDKTLTWTLTSINVTDYVLNLFKMTPEPVIVETQTGGNVLNYTSPIDYGTSTTFTLIIMNTANNASTNLDSRLITFTQPAIITFASWSDGLGNTIDIEWGSGISFYAIFNNSITGNFNVYTSDTINTSVLGGPITINYTSGDITQSRTYTIVDSTPPYFETWSDSPDESVNVPYGSSYTLPTAYFRDNTVEGIIVVTPNPTSINTSILDSITVNYTYGGVTKPRTYNIVDNVFPTFVSWVDGEGDIVNVEYDTAYTLPQANFTDNEKGDFVVPPTPATINTNVALNTEYVIDYLGTDNAGKSTLQQRTYIIKDNQFPYFVSWVGGGDDNVNVEYKSAYILPQANFSDNERGNFVVDPTPATIDTNILGQVYTINYWGTDNAGNPTLKPRTYTIVDTTPPTYTLHITTEPQYFLGGGGTFKVHFNFTELTEQVYITIKDSPFSAFVLNNQSVSSASYTKTYEAVDDSNKYYLIKVEDTNGIFTEITRLVEFTDTTAPTFDMTTTTINLTTTFNLTNINEPNCRIELNHNKVGESSSIIEIVASTGANSTYEFTRTEVEYATFDYIVRIFDEAGLTSNNYEQIELTYNNGLSTMTITNPTTTNIRLDFTGVGTYDHIHYSINGATDTMLGSGVNFVEFDNSYGTFNISARAVNSGHALIGNILTDSITLVEPTGTIGIPNITDLSFTVDITDINKDYIIVDLLDYA